MDESLFQRESEERERKKNKKASGDAGWRGAIFHNQPIGPEETPPAPPPAPCGRPGGRTILGPYPGKAIVGARRQEGPVALEGGGATEPSVIKAIFLIF